MTSTLLITWLMLLSVGALAGLLAGLLGIGGGLVIVPALLLLLDQAPAYAMHMAVGTSLATIVATGSASAWSHHRRGAVAWEVVARLAPGLLAGSLAAAWLAAQLSSRALAVAFGLFCLLVARQMLRPVAERAGPARAGSVELALAGTGIGLVSALVGIGGGTLTVPYLHWRGMAMRRSVATAAACGVPIALAGSAGFVLSGWRVAGLPGPHLGFVHLPGLAAIVLTSVLFAPLGAALAHRLPTTILRRAFALLLVVMGLLLMLRNAT